MSRYLTLGFLLVLQYYLGTALLFIINDDRRRNKQRNLMFLCAGLHRFRDRLDRRTRRIWMHERTRNYWERDVQAYNSAQWIENFGMTKKTFDEIVKVVRSDMKPEDVTVREAVCVEKRTAIAVYKLASAAEYRTIAQNFGVSKSTVHNCLKRFCLAINKQLTKFIHMPSQEEAQQTANRIDMKHHFPQVMGCIAVMHIPIMVPTEGNRVYTNQKGWDSIIVQAVVDDCYMFRDINVGMPGSNDDAAVFKQSGLNQHSAKLPKAPIMMNNVEVPLLISSGQAFYWFPFTSGKRIV